MTGDAIAPKSERWVLKNDHLPQPTMERNALDGDTKGEDDHLREQKNLNADSYQQLGQDSVKYTEAKLHGDEEAPESEQARIERLGRERPAKFKSFGAELAFCYSIIASQFMAVSSPF